MCPVAVVVAAMELTMTSWLVSGRQRQFMEIWVKSLCSFRFHALVPGDGWQTGSEVRTHRLICPSSSIEAMVFTIRSRGAFRSYSCKGGR